MASGAPAAVQMGELVYGGAAEGEAQHRWTWRGRWALSPGAPVTSQFEYELTGPADGGNRPLGKCSLSGWFHYLQNNQPTKYQEG